MIFRSYGLLTIVLHHVGRNLKLEGGVAANGTLQARTLARGPWVGPWALGPWARALFGFVWVP